MTEKFTGKGRLVQKKQAPRSTTAAGPPSRGAGPLSSRDAAAYTPGIPADGGPQGGIDELVYLLISSSRSCGVAALTGPGAAT